MGYWLVNWTRKELIRYGDIGAETKNELTFFPPAAAVTSWYMLTHLGDRISFINDSYPEWPFPDGSWDDISWYEEISTKVVDELVENGILIDEGREIFWEDEPEVYMRRLRVRDYQRVPEP